MMPTPQADYYAQALVYRIINETERAQRGILSAIQSGDLHIAERFSRQWKEEIFKACHEMNQAAADMIQRQQQEIIRLMSIIPMQPFVMQTGAETKAAMVDPTNGLTVEELYRELKPDPPPPFHAAPDPDDVPF